MYVFSNLVHFILFKVQRSENGGGGGIDRWIIGGTTFRDWLCTWLKKLKTNLKRGNADFKCTGVISLVVVGYI